MTRERNSTGKIVSTPKVLPHGCSRCASRWGGAAQAHCSVCCLTFTTVSNFDRHRTGGVDNRTCTNPANDRRFSEVRPGLWGGVGEYDRLSSTAQPGHANEEDDDD